MEFGQVSSAVLDAIDFTLPPDHPRTGIVLGNTITGKTGFHIGCAKWSRKDWVGKLYPKGTKEADYLKEYARQFNCIEFNAIYYQLPAAQQIAAWRSKVGADFLFCPKFSDIITHRKRLQNVTQELDSFLQSIYELGPNLGPVFLMPHPQMGPQSMETILRFVASVPTDIRLFVELRHPDWYLPPYFEEISSRLELMGRGMVITDAAGRRDCVHMRLSTPEAFIRFVGNSLHASDYRRIDSWVQRLRVWMDEGLQSCYFFMHQHDELYSPELSQYLVQQLNQHCGLDIQVPRLMSDMELF